MIQILLGWDENRSVKNFYCGSSQYEYDFCTTVENSGSDFFSHDNSAVKTHGKKH